MALPAGGERVPRALERVTAEAKAELGEQVCPQSRRAIRKKKKERTHRFESVRGPGNS